MDRPAWRRSVKTGSAIYEANRIEEKISEDWFSNLRDQPDRRRQGQEKIPKTGSAIYEANRIAAAKAKSQEKISEDWFSNLRDQPDRRRQGQEKIPKTGSAIYEANRIAAAKAKTIYEVNQIAAAKAKRMARKSPAPRTNIVDTQALSTRSRSQRIFHARIGLNGNLRTQCTNSPVIPTSMSNSANPPSDSPTLTPGINSITPIIIETTSK
ncbi:unnamed protein product [Schistocephalus solidus]|uniref:Uncharacterized protein n=1 Tax=Schistocephalus solidus TaxID=70667 RepID=A0A183TLV4_SCHSO|nr:unnamed protein product [Schistocephalus solidus]